MKIAIASQNPSKKARVDKHFGKCSHFLIHDDETGITEIMENPGKGIQDCKGDLIVKRLVEKKVRRVIAGDFGTHVQQLLNKHHIQMIIYPDDTRMVSDIIELLSLKTH